MATTNNIEELKQAFGSDDLSTCFKYLFNNEISEDVGFLIRIGDECSQLRAKIAKRNNTIREAQFCGSFDSKAVNVLRCLLEIQQRERNRLQQLTAIIDEVHEGIQEKQRHVSLMEFDEEFPDD